MTKRKLPSSSSTKIHLDRQYRMRTIRSRRTACFWPCSGPMLYKQRASSTSSEILQIRSRSSRSSQPIAYPNIVGRLVFVVRTVFSVPLVSSLICTRCVHTRPSVPVRLRAAGFPPAGGSRGTGFVVTSEAIIMHGGCRSLRTR
jgi:hypothetical protein